jgi:hypothetical protein
MLVGLSFLQKAGHNLLPQINMEEVCEKVGCSVLCSIVTIRYLMIAKFTPKVLLLKPSSKNTLNEIQAFSTKTKALQALSNAFTAKRHLFQQDKEESCESCYDESFFQS